jgi:hypothetical protein
MDNNYANVGSINGQELTFYDPRDPTKLHTPVTVSNVVKAAADTLADPSKHNGKTYQLVAPTFSLKDAAAAAFSKTLGKEVTVPYEAAKEAFMGMGFPNWQMDGILEFFKYIDKEYPITNGAEQTGNIELISAGEKPLTMELSGLSRMQVDFNKRQDRTM